jgi:hypothetical protein
MKKKVRSEASLEKNRQGNRRRYREKRQKVLQDIADKKEAIYQQWLKEIEEEEERHEEEERSTFICNKCSHMRI